MTRTARASDLMWPRLFRRFDGRTGTRQGQVRDMLVHALMEGFVAPGAGLPSSRVLADALGLSRTTVTLALQSLAERGLIEGRARSGYYASAQVRSGHADARPRSGASEVPAPTAWHKRLLLQPSAQRNIQKPRDWQLQPYPFLYGQFDATLFPYRDWRACALETLAARSVRRWAPDQIDRDDDALVDQIHRRLLPARGIWAEREQILVTAGAQQATFLLAMLLVGPATHVGVERPGYPDARNSFALRTKHVHALRIDADGLVPGTALARCDYVFVTPSHQCPTTVTMPFERRTALLAQAERDDFVLIEDDHESELNFSGKPTPALKSLDSAQRVLYVGSLSKTLAHGLRLGFVVAPVPLIRELRALRRLVMRHVCSNNQQAAASFIAHGHHEAYVHRLNQAYRDRARALRHAIASHAPMLQPMAAQGGSALWVSGPRGLDTRALAQRLLPLGVLVEPGDVFYPGTQPPRHHLRIGYSSITPERIEPGVRLLGRELARLRTAPVARARAG